MKNYIVKRYESADYDKWNDFIGQAKNATFLFHRDFMEYHKDRFEDYSLIVLDGEKWVAVLPANVVGDEVFSHQGLTYGGLLYDEKVKLASVITIFKTILSFLNQRRIQKMQLKLIPSIYHQKPAEELSYALFLAEAKLIRRDTLAVIDLSQNNQLSKDRKNALKRALVNNLVIKEENSFDLFWNEILIPNLELRHNNKPVHSLEEISKLRFLFPENIRQFNVYKDNLIIAGTTLFLSKNVVHSQYMSKNIKEGNYGSLEMLHYYLLNIVFKEKKFFDFGISNEFQGKKLNEGLSYWKESFGASTVIHDFYEVDTSTFYLLENVLI